MIPKKSSKELLLESAMELITKYPVDKVTVSDIARNCNVSTRTFYNHFNDKYDLIAESYIHLLEQRYNEYPGTHDFHRWLTFTVEVVWEYYDYFASAVNYHGQNNLNDSIMEPLKKRYLNLIRDTYHDEITDEINDAVTFFLFGCIGYANHLLRSGNIQNPQMSVTILENCLPSCLKVYLYRNGTA